MRFQRLLISSLSLTLASNAADIALQEAIVNGNYEKAIILFNDVDIDHVFPDGSTLLELAVQNARAHLVSQILKLHPTITPEIIAYAKEKLSLVTISFRSFVEPSEELKLEYESCRTIVRMLEEYEKKKSCIIQ